MSEESKAEKMMNDYDEIVKPIQDAIRPYANLIIGNLFYIVLALFISLYVLEYVGCLGGSSKNACEDSCCSSKSQSCSKTQKAVGS